MSLKQAKTNGCSTLRARRTARTALTALVATTLQFAAASTAIAACWDATHPDSRYIVNAADGSVIDTSTGLAGNTKLMWKQCVEGKSGAGCATGTATYLNFANAGLAGLNSTDLGYDDWRAPTREELLTLVPAACAALSPPDSIPTINRTVFPGTAGVAVWSSSPDAGNPSNAWDVYFGFGAAVSVDQRSTLQVRLIRGGQSLNPLITTAQTLVFGTPPTLTLGTSPTFSATSDSGRPIRYGSSTPGVCTVNASTGQITLTGTATAGNTCTVNANQYGGIYSGVNYAPAAQVSQSLAVVKAAQTISFTSTTPGSAVVNGASYTVTASATSSLAVSLTIAATSSTVCTLFGSAVSFIGAGVCRIRADQAGDATYEAATQVNQDVSVGAGSQTLTFGVAPSINVGGAGAVSASSNRGLTPVNFTSTTPTVCTVSGSTVTALSAGTCIIAADQLGNTNYNAAPQVLQTIGVGKASQTITGFAPTTPVVFGAAAQTLTATPGASSSPLVFSLTSGPCALTGASLIYTGAGNCVVAVNQAGDANYNAAAPLNATVVVGKANQVIVFGTTPSVAVGGAGTVTATGGLSGNAVTFTSTTPLVCAINVATVTALAAGNCIIAADQPGNGNYNAAPQVLQTIGVGKASQTITGFTPTTPVVFGAAAQTLIATAGASTSPLVFSLTSGPCALAGASLSYTGAGNCVVAVNQAADANYNVAAQVSATVVVNEAAQTIVFGAAPAINVGGSGTVSATGGASGNPVTFTITTPTICTNSGINGATITAVLGGNCIIAANQLGNGNYNEAPQVTQTIAVGAAGSTMTITSSANPSKAGQAVTFNVVVVPVIPSAAKSNSVKALTQAHAIPTGNVTFTDNGNLIATVPLDANGRASYTTPSLLVGIHTITASYSGDASSAAGSATVIQAVDALIVPTLSAWMLALLGLMLATLGVRARRNA